ncbi:MAG: anthranilate synthase component I [Planctomycetes bacterium]|nr:anthranilate synthase component I [Planctomycetota bacterium]
MKRNRPVGKGASPVYRPTIEEFRRMAGSANMIPVYKEIFADALTPVLAFQALAGSGGYGFLLESVEGEEKIGRFSFIGVDPSMVFRASSGYVETEREGVNARRENVDPFGALAEIAARHRPAHVDGLPRFSGGAVGYIAYDAVRYIEKLPDAPADDMGLPDILLGFYESLVIFDRFRNTVKVVSYARTDGLWEEEAYAGACAKVEAVIEKLAEARPEAIRPTPPPSEPAGFKSSFTKEGYEAAVEKAVEYIRAGDIVQTVLSQRLEVETGADPFEVYRTLRFVNPSPYMFYLSFPEVTLVGSSPEVMIRVEEGKLTLRPIAGTIRRGRDAAEDERLAAELLGDPKERAEHIMLVDLARNDVGRVAETGSVEVTELMTVERYSHVMHIVSNVEGKLREGLNALEALKSALPAGTVSGAPKVRAMEIIDELEPVRRGPYAGAVGYIDLFGNLDTCITIRTIVFKGGKAYVQAGAGIVADSIPAKEYAETLSKARALLSAIRMTEGE